MNSVSKAIATAVLAPIGPEWERTSISARVYKELRKAIVSMQLLPGHTLSEAEIARQLGTSRQPVREAFIKLAEAGFIEIKPQKGTQVLKISSGEVANARYLRQTLEVAIARRSAEKPDHATLKEIRLILDAQLRACKSDDHEGFIRLDDDFHRLVAIAGGFGKMWRLVEDLKGQMDRVRFLSIPEATPMMRLIEQHTEVADCIQVGDPDGAGNAMQRHLSEMLISLPILAERHPELFSD
ncbi:MULTISPECIES: GntR family transcriptional regulator [Chelativorans]|uniref:Transcriptional regulator, GntR family n=1 Tax=Chelativorans sp. (strain BNC1) TaxID=266779 RepID=Q11AP8_CHESB|nr:MULTISPECIES: GntR family transcriptional regulator [Chelativorans]